MAWVLVESAGGRRTAGGCGLRSLDRRDRGPRRNRRPALHRAGFTDDLSSAEEARVWRDGIQVDGAAVSGRAVLLLADASSSQWPITVAAAKLRESGAAAVLPLLIHKRP